MTDKTLLSLREISKQLNFNYRTVIDCKNNYSEFFMVKNEGRNTKYLPEYADLFMLIFALKDEGFSESEIKKILRGQHPDPPDFDDWIPKWVKIIQDGWTDGYVDGCMDGRMEVGTDGCMDGRMEVGTDGCMDGRMDDTEKEHFEKMMDDLKQEILSTLPEMITKEIQSISDNHESALSDLTAQINAALTQIYKVVTQLQDHLQALHTRLQHLEKELGAEPGSDIAITELDLEQLQITKQQQPEPAPLDQHATIEFVKASISDGKPDRQAVIQWIQAERGRNPSVSYGELAEMLDGAGVPTLRGSTGWNRGTIRNLVVK